MAPGLILAIGTTRLWFVADIGLILFVMYRGRANFRWHPVVLGLSAIIGATAMWSPDPGSALMAAVRMNLLFSLVRDPEIFFRFGIAGEPQRRVSRWFDTRRFTRGGVFAGAALVLVLQVVAALAQLPFEQRVHGISINASQLGQTGFVFMAWPPLYPVAALTLGLSTARAAALGLIIFALFARTRRLFMWSGVAAAVFLTIIFWKTPDRIMPSGIITGLEWRGQIIEQGASEQDLTGELLAACGPVRERVWRWYGYGYHGYCLQTGLQRPHNILVLSWWDIGVFAVPFWLLAGYGAYRTRRYGMLAALVAVGMITEELFGRPEGFYMVAIALALKGPGDVNGKGHQMDHTDGKKACQDVMDTEPVHEQEQ